MPNGGTRRYIPKPTRGVRAKSSSSASHVYMKIYSRFFGNIKVHRLVCEAFHGPAPFTKAVVIHLDENGTNNWASNLRWGTQKENLNMPKIKAYHRSRTGDNNPFIKGRKRKLEELQRVNQGTGRA